VPGEASIRSHALPVKLRRNIIASVAGALVLCSFLYLALGRKPYRLRKATADSDEVRQALEVVRLIAAAPEGALDYASSEAKESGRVALAEAAKQMSGAQSVELKDAAWFGHYLRLGVTCKKGGKESFRGHFFLKREQGQLRITGLDR